MLSQALNHAVATQVLGRNVAQFVKPPRPKRKDISPLTREGVIKLLGAASQTEFYYPLLVAIYTGLRRSELLALTWADMDLEERYLSVNKGIHTHSSESERIQPPKTDKSKRLVSLPIDLVLALRHHRETQEAIWDELGKSMGMGDRIFARPDGSVIHPDSLSKACVRLAKQAGLGGPPSHSQTYISFNANSTRGEYQIHIRATRSFQHGVY